MIKINLEKHVSSPEVRKYSGIHAKFCEIDDEWGVKFFNSEGARDKNYRYQLTGYNNGYAPKLGPKVQFEYDGEICYGYITEKVTVFGNAVAEYHGIKHNGTYDNDSGNHNYEYNSCMDVSSYYGKEFIDNNEEWAIAYDEIVRYVNKYGLCDIHGGNWGITSDGRAVIIDFSCC